MESAIAPFADAVDQAPISAPKIPVIGNVTARPLESAADIRAELEQQLISPVRWTGSINYLIDQGVDTFVEVGPGEVLLGLIKRISRSSKRVKFDENISQIHSSSS